MPDNYVNLSNDIAENEFQKIVIDKVYLKNTTKTFYKNVNFYEDKLNSLYREDELLTLEEAQNIIGMNALSHVEIQKPVAEIKKINFQRKYQDGEILYSAIAAKSGKIEKVVIKKYSKDNVLFSNHWI